MKESINIFKTSKQSGEKLNNSSWFSPAEIEKNILKKERKRFIVILCCSNIFVWLLGSNLFTNEKKEQPIKLTKDHSVVQVNAEIHIPIHNKKTSITLIKTNGKFISNGLIMPRKNQSPLTNNGPWKIEIPNKNITKVLNSSSNLKIIPKTEIQKAKKRNINEIRF